MLDGVHHGTAQDMQTAMQLFGSAIVDQVDTSVNTVLSENHQMREMASEMATASTQAKDQFKGAMLRAVEAEGGIEQLNAFGSELSASIQFIGSEVKRSMAIVRDASAQAEITRSCVETMATLSRTVSDVTKMIDGIARQTRMLALNANIEAARAGEVGKGFGVVANEVKQLAHQTADATNTIGQKIAEMNGMVRESVESLEALVDTTALMPSAAQSDRPSPNRKALPRGSPQTLKACATRCLRYRVKSARRRRSLPTAGCCPKWCWRRRIPSMGT
jgi:methyl-accepting chemotaxis protein